MKNQIFSDYVSSSAFTLSLSKGMIDTLLVLALADDYKSVTVTLSRFMMHADALRRRGLIIHKPHLFASGEQDYTKRAWHVTAEGRLVAQLLVLAGHACPVLLEESA